MLKKHIANTHWDVQNLYYQNTVLHCCWLPRRCKGNVYCKHTSSALVVVSHPCELLSSRLPNFRHPPASTATLNAGQAILVLHACTNSKQYYVSHQCNTTINSSSQYPKSSWTTTLNEWLVVAIAHCTRRRPTYKWHWHTLVQNSKQHLAVAHIGELLSPDMASYIAIAFWTLL